MAPTSSATRVSVTDDGPVRHVVMNRPDARNALDPVMIEQLASAFDRAAEERPRVVVLSGAGQVFSAGADLEYMRSMADFTLEDNMKDARRLAGLFAAIRDCPCPVVARVHGAAIGGGVGLVAASDISVAAADTVFAFSETRLGIAPAVISPFVVPRIGLAAARELFLTGERFSAGRAREIGLVSRVVQGEDLDDAVSERIEALLAGGPSAQAAVKRLLDTVAPLPPGLSSATARTIAELRASPEGREGMSAFLERRRPSWASAAREPASTVAAQTGEGGERES